MEFFGVHNPFFGLFRESMINILRKKWYRCKISNDNMPNGLLLIFFLMNKKSIFYSLFMNCDNYFCIHCISGNPHLQTTCQSLALQVLKDLFQSFYWKKRSNLKHYLATHNAYNGGSKWTKKNQTCFFKV